MATAIDVANFFISVSKDVEDPLTKLRLIKFVYNAQGCALARIGKPLFDEDVEAWKDGPVIPSVYKAFRSYDKVHIKETHGKYSENAFSPEQLKVLIDVAVKYGEYSTSKLWNLCHRHGGAWDKVYDPNKRHIKIPKDFIYEDFSKYASLGSFDLNSIKRYMKSVGYHDSEGYTVLPKEYDE